MLVLVLFSLKCFLPFNIVVEMLVSHVPAGLINDDITREWRRSGLGYINKRSFICLLQHTRSSSFTGRVVMY